MLFSTFFWNINAQSLERRLIGTAGNQIDQNNIQFEWSMGETFVSTLITNEYIVTQGLHQGNKLASYIYSQTEWSDLITIYPNPAHHELRLLKETDILLNYHVLNSTGQLITTGTWETRTDKININILKEGVFLLVIKDNNDNAQSYKFIKQ